MVVGSPQRFYVALANGTGVLQIGASPGEPVAAEVRNKEIRQQPRVPAIAVRKWVDLHETMVEADRDLIGRIRTLFNPCPRRTFFSSALLSSWRKLMDEGIKSFRS